MKTLLPLSCLAAACLISCTLPPPVDRLADYSATIRSIPDGWKDEPIVILSDTVDLRLDVHGPAGNTATRRECVWYYVNRRNPNVLEQWAVPDFENIEEAADIQVSAYFPDGEHWQLSPMSINRFRYKEEESSSSNRFISAFSLPRYVQGMLIRVDIARTFTRPEFLKTEVLREEYPALAKTVLLTLPREADIRYGIINPEGLKIDSVRTQSPSGASASAKGETFRVSAANLNKLDARTMPHKPEAWFAALHVSFPPRGVRSFTWKELGDEYLASIKASMAVTPEMEKLAEGVTAKEPDSLIARIQGILRSRVRYHADVDKLHAFVPRPAGEVLAKGYGDCKEMATLMALLLRKKGVKAGMALVSPPGTFQVLEAYPSLGGFNHMIAYVETPGKAGETTLRFFDPTIKFGDPFDSYFPTMDRTTLVLADGASRLTAVTVTKGFRNRVETKSAIKRDATGKGWMLEGNIRLDGLSAFNLFPMLETARGDEKAPFLKAYLKEAFGLEAVTCKADATPDRSTIDIDYGASFTANYLDLDKGGLLVNLPSLYGGEVRYTALEFEGPRHFIQVEQHDAWEVPEEFPEFKSEALSNALAKGKWTRDGKLIKRNYAAQTLEMPAEKRGEASDYAKQRTRFSRATLWHK